MWEPNGEGDGTRRAALAQVWWKAGLLEDGFTLTPAGEEVVAMEQLLSYEYNMLTAHRHDDVVNVAQQHPGNYDLLRRGLGAYFERHLGDLFGLLDLTSSPCCVLDYGAGAGLYSDRLKRDSPSSEFWLLDRPGVVDSRPWATHLELDFEKEPAWYRPYHARFGLVIMAELLHCKGRGGRRYLYESASHVLMPGGRLLVVERESDLLNWRLALMTGEGESLSLQRVKEEAEHYAGFSYAGGGVNTLSIGDHYALLLTREEGL